MDKETAKDKIRKLLAHSESAKRIGNKAEARAYRNRAALMMKKYGVTKSSLNERAENRHLGNVIGVWRCCECNLEIRLDAPRLFVDMMLASHKKLGHRVEQVS